jgi:hypothetical protein
MWWENSPKLDVGIYYILCELFTNIITIDPIYSSHNCHNCHNALMAINARMANTLFPDDRPRFILLCSISSTSYSGI